MSCSLKIRDIDQQQAQAGVEYLKGVASKTVMTDALQRGIPIAVLLKALLESAASSLASAVVLDSKNRALCSMDDAAHIEEACELFRQAANRTLAEARRQLLEPVQSVSIN